MHVYLGHGASGTAASMRPYVDGLRGNGIQASALELPKANAERAMPRLLAQVDVGHPEAVIGGHSYGGRVASMVAADAGDFAGLVLLSYPLHRPGKSHEGLRTQHWPAIACPVLLLSGESDPFARVQLLRDAVGLLPHAQLITYPGLGHGLGAARDQVVARIASFVRALPRRRP